MKTEDKLDRKSSVIDEKEFDAVRFMREQRDRITKEVIKMSDVEIVAYFEKRTSDFHPRPKLKR